MAAGLSGGDGILGKLVPRWVMRGVLGGLIAFRAGIGSFSSSSGSSSSSSSTIRSTGGEVGKEEGKVVDEGVNHPLKLAALMRYDFAVVEGMVGDSGRFAGLGSCFGKGGGGGEGGGGGDGDEIMLLAGGKSPVYLHRGVDLLAAALMGDGEGNGGSCGVRKVMLPGVDHLFLGKRPGVGVPLFLEFFG